MAWPPLNAGNSGRSLSVESFCRARVSPHRFFGSSAVVASGLVALPRPKALGIDADVLSARVSSAAVTHVWKSFGTCTWCVLTAVYCASRMGFQWRSLSLLNVYRSYNTGCGGFVKLDNERCTGVVLDCRFLVQVCPSLCMCVSPAYFLQRTLVGSSD